MGITERRERQRQEVRCKILDAARELLAEEGNLALTMRRVAEKIEYSAASLYLHFSDKAALVRALCTHDFYVFAAQFQGVSEISDPLDRLRRIGQLYVDFALAHPQQYRVMFMARPPIERFDSIERGNPEQDAYAILEQAVAYALEHGLFPQLRDAPALLAQTLWAGVHGVVSLEIAMRLPDAPPEEAFIPLEDVRRRAALMMDALLLGLQRGAS